jgi:hypothetical protein
MAGGCGAARRLLSPSYPGKSTVALPSQLPLCPWCGLPALERPHVDSTDCIRALEAEVGQLKRLLERLKPTATIDDEEYA